MNDNEIVKSKYIKYKLKYQRLRNSQNNFNFYSLNEKENIFSRPFYQCPIFSTHNTFLKKTYLPPNDNEPIFASILKDLFFEDPIEKFELEDYIKYLINLTEYFPVCIEIDNLLINNFFGDGCIVGHAISKIKTITSNILTIDMLVNKIITSYQNKILKSKFKLFPIIIHFDVKNPKCLTSIFEKYDCENGEFEKYCKYSSKTLGECMNKYIFREKIFGEKQKIKFNKIAYTKSKSINFRQLNSIISNPNISINEICIILNIDLENENLHYRLYPTTGEGGQELISFYLIKLINKLFEMGHINFISKFKLPTLIAFNLYYYWKNDFLTEEQKSEFTLLFNNFKNLYRRIL